MGLGMSLSSGLPLSRLRVVELRQSRRAEASRELRADGRLRDVVAEEAVVDVARDGGLVHSEGLERSLGGGEGGEGGCQFA
jgi:hypothetical protein